MVEGHLVREAGPTVSSEADITFVKITFVHQGLSPAEVAGLCLGATNELKKHIFSVESHRAQHQMARPQA